MSNEQMQKCRLFNAILQCWAESNSTEPGKAAHTRKLTLFYSDLLHIWTVSKI